MKKTMLWGTLFTLICAHVQADVTPQSTQTQTPGSAATPSSNDKMTQTPTNQNAQPTQGTQQGQPQVQGQPATTQPTQIQNPQQNQTGQQTTTQLQAQPAPVINCDYKIPAETKTIEQSLVLTWTEKATTQAFDFDPATLDSQVQKLKACFTEQGWTGFSSALEKSGNLEAIKTQKLTVSSQLDGQGQVTEAKDNQWKITLPLQVVYQNDKEKVTQLLTVNLTVGRKITGDLGIAQMIATPRVATPTNPVTGSTAPSSSTTTNNPAATNTTTTPVNTAPTTTTPVNTTTSPTPTPTSTTPPTNTGTPH